MKKQRLKELKEVNGVLLLREYNMLLNDPNSGINNNEVLKLAKGVLLTIGPKREFTQKRTLRVLRILLKNKNLSEEVRVLVIEKINSML